MSVLQPQIIKIGTRRYRKNPFTLSFQQPDSNTNLEPYEEETIDMFVQQPVRNKCDAYDDEVCNLDRKSSPNDDVDEDDFKDIELTKNQTYQCKIKVNKEYYGFIIGRNGEKKAKLERDTSTRIKIPGRNQSDDDVIKVEGNNMKNVASCRNRLFLMIGSARDHKSFTHLLTFPLHFENLKTKFNEFRERVVSECANDRGVSSTMFINNNKLHLTICTMTLLDDNEVDQAINLLNECKRTFINELLNSQPIKVRIKGLEYMNDDPSEVDVLYAKVETNDEVSSYIQQISDRLLKKFVDSGLSKKQFDRVKLHATIMNSLLSRDPTGLSTASRGANNKLTNRDRESFDARNILRLFGDFDFGYYTLNEIHLSIRYSSGSDNYYDYASKITL